jgi:two-component system phosphate regulon response regulator PhoB
MHFYVVDDDMAVLNLLTRVLEKAGHRVEASPSGAAALKQIPMSRPDCIITDIMMPEMDGFELIRGLRSRPELSDMKIIVLSAKSYEFDRRRAKELGADGYMTKPFDPEALVGSINAMLSTELVVEYWACTAPCRRPALNTSATVAIPPA